MDRLRPWLPAILLGTLGLISVWAMGALLINLHEVIGGDAFGVDRQIMRWVWENTHPGWKPLLQYLSWLLAAHNWPLLAGGVLLGIWALRRAERPCEAIGLGVSLAVTALAVLLAKAIFHRERPDVEWALARETSFSFPSGHSVHAVVIFGMMAYLAGRLTKNWRIGITGIVVALLLSFATAWSRVYLGVHYPTDVLAGLGVGGVLLATGILTTETLYILRRPKLAEDLQTLALAARKRAKNVIAWGADGLRRRGNAKRRRA